MRKYLRQSFFALLLFLAACPGSVTAQKYSNVTNYTTVNKFYDDTLMKQGFSIDVVLFLNPLYISQFSSKYVLNGQRLTVKPGPRFYGITPNQIPFSDIGETADQSNAIYVSWPLKKWDRSKSKLFHDMRMVVGITHDKLQTGKDSIYYKFPDGGTELTVMLDKNITHSLKDLDFKAVNLIFNVDIQAGLFASLSNINSQIYSADTIFTENYTRWIWNTKPFTFGGWGWLTVFKMELGGVLCHSYFITEKFTAHTWLGRVGFNILKHVAFTVGAQAMAEGLYTSTKVTVNGVSGSLLKVSNYGIFMAGPVVGIKLINL